MKSYLLSSISTTQRREIAGGNFGDKKCFQMPNTVMIKCCQVFFVNELRPIFEKLSKDELLSCCLKGLTQNQNESLNSQLWDN